MIYHDLPFKKYLEIKALSSTALKDFIESPVLYKWNRDNPKKETGSQFFGTAVHAWILERPDFDNQYVPLDSEVIKAVNNFREEDIDFKSLAPVPKQRRGTKVWKELEVKYAGKHLIFEDEYEQLVSIYNLNKKIGDKIMIETEMCNDIKELDVEIQGQNELSVEFMYRGVKCKARFDSVINDGIIDVKTTKAPYKFEREIMNYKYYIQAAFYSIAYKEIFGKEPDYFKWLAVPNSKPYSDISMHKIHPEFLEYGINIVDHHIDLFKICQDNNDFSRPVPETEVFKPNYL